MPNSEGLRPRALLRPAGLMGVCVWGGGFADFSKLVWVETKG